MIQITIQCDRCRREQEQRSVKNGSDLDRWVKSLGYRWVTNPDNKQILLGPACLRAYATVKKQVEDTKKETIGTWFEGSQDK